MDRYLTAVIWFFERRGQLLQCEIRMAPVGTGYELVWTASDGQTRIERSNDPRELLYQRRALEQWLALDGWVRVGRRTPPRPLRMPSPQRQQARVDEIAPPEPVPTQRIIVRRGHLTTFEQLLRTFAHDPGVEVIWDRRVMERRQTVRPATDDRRRHERRRRPPDRWTRLNYLVVPAAGNGAREAVSSSPAR